MARSFKLLTLGTALTLSLAACESLPRGKEDNVGSTSAAATAPAVVTPVASPPPATAAIDADAGRPLVGPDGRPASGNVIGRFAPPK